MKVIPHHSNLGGDVRNPDVGGVGRGEPGAFHPRQLTATIANTQPLIPARKCPSARKCVSAHFMNHCEVQIFRLLIQLLDSHLKCATTFLHHSILKVLNHAFNLVDQDGILAVCPHCRWQSRGQNQERRSDRYGDKSAIIRGDDACRFVRYAIFEKSN